MQDHDDQALEEISKSDYEKFYLVIGGHIFFQTLSAAVELDLFTLLSKEGPLTRTEIAKRLEIEEKPVRILLLGCAALGLIQKQGEAYINKPISESLLTKHSSRNLISFVQLEHHIIYKPMFHFLEAIRENRNVGLEEFEGTAPTLYQRLTGYPELEKIFQNAMQELTAHANSDLARHIDFSRFRHIVDVGGGDATNIIELAKHWPNLHAAVFDFPSVCQIARDNIQGAGLGDRLSTIPGNCFQDEFPKEADCLLFAHFFTIWSEDEDRLLLRKSFDALPSGGSVVIFNMMQSNDESGPLTAAIGSPYFLTLATGKGMLYTWNEYETWMKETGFVDIEKHELPEDHGVIIGTKP